MQLRRVVVTGLGALTPIGNDAPSFFQGLQAGISGAGLITHFDTEKFKVKFACEVKNFNPEDFFDRKEARKMDPFTQFAMVAADEAINHSGLLQQSYNPDRIGVIWGAGIGGLTTFFAEIVDYAKGDGTPRFSPFFIPKMIVDIAPGYISIKHGFRGPNFSTVSACASSTHALIDAFNYIRLGKADAIVAGGSEASVNEPSVGGFSNMKALSERNDDFLTASRPFDKDRDGFVMGEGAAAMILEDYEHAKARGAKIYAEIVGGGMTADAYHLTAPHPEGLGACNVMKAALDDAGMTAADIDYINVHGTSTPLGDIAESKAILSVFGEHAYNLNISSTKSMTGHLLGGAGAIESLACVMAVSENVIPPTINHFTDDPEFDPKLNFTFNVAQKRTVRAALSNTFGFGGHNASVIFKKFEG
jgi:3-oxoacyl-[acyl-carrier-protein] synthase II